MKFFFSFLFSILVLFFCGCRNKKDKLYTMDPAALWFDYQVTAKEGNDNLTVLLQYKYGGEDGFAVAAGNVALDGERFPADSASMTGVFYELNKPIASFTGNHTILFTDLYNKQYKDSFSFQPLLFVKPPTDTLQRSDLAFKLVGLDKEDYISVLLTDTSYINNGINRVDKLINGNLYISKTDLENLANGSVQLELVREQERMLKNGTEVIGRLLITYSLKRDFFLKD